MDKFETYQKFAQNVINSKNETIKIFTELKKNNAKLLRSYILNLQPY